MISGVKETHVVSLGVVMKVCVGGVLLMYINPHDSGGMLTLYVVLAVGGPMMEALAQSYSSHGLDQWASSLRKEKERTGSTFIPVMLLMMLMSK